jgi:hypothetical protein
VHNYWQDYCSNDKWKKILSNVIDN